VTQATVERAIEARLEELRTPLLAYCYRMLGSPHEAEDAVQETMIRAWRGLAGLADPSGLRPWVYKIATNVCIDALSARRGRALPMDLAGPADPRDDLGVPLAESTWVRPIPSRLLETDDPLERAVSRESIRLAFVAALQHLLPRQRAVLILRDVLCWRAAEVAALLETSVDAVNSTVRRARAALAEAQRGSVPGEPVDVLLLERYIDAFTRFDIDRIVSLLHDDAVISMPPYAFWLRGSAAFGAWLESSEFRRFMESSEIQCGHARLVPTEANGSAAIAAYSRDASGSLVPAAIHVLEARAGRIVGLHAFLEPDLFPLFGFPTG
jgi:RNA polymerase sigma-70 factor (ECF subfamily)